MAQKHIFIQIQESGAIQFSLIPVVMMVTCRALLYKIGTKQNALSHLHIYTTHLVNANANIQLFLIVATFCMENCPSGVVVPLPLRTSISCQPPNAPRYIDVRMTIQ